MVFFFFLWTHGRFPRERGMEYDENELSLESTKNQSDQHRKQGGLFKKKGVKMKMLANFSFRKTNQPKS